MLNALRKQLSGSNLARTSLKDIICRIKDNIVWYFTTVSKFRFVAKNINTDTNSLCSKLIKTSSDNSHAVQRFHNTTYKNHDKNQWK